MTSAARDARRSWSRRRFAVLGGAGAGGSPLRPTHDPARGAPSYEDGVSACEPRAANPAPNRMLRTIGFPLLQTYVGASSELSAVCELNRYEILRDVAEAYLASRGS